MLPGLDQLILTCAPQVAPVTMQAVVRVESGGNPNVLNINGGEQLARQPRNQQEASAWAEWLVKNRYSVDMGLAQINSANLARLGLTPTQALDPCTNLRAGAKILTENYLGAAQRYGGGQTALQAALSAYNTGNHRSGFTNGYVAKVTAAAGVNPNTVGTGIVQYSPPPLTVRPLAQNTYRNTTPTRKANYTYTAPSYNGHSRQVAGSSASPMVVWVKR